jgi:hypothetical protein
MKFFTLILILLSMNAEAQTKRTTTMNFEDDVIEGINRKNLDSVNQISERDKKNQSHLYRKRAGFSDLDTGLLADTLELRTK